MTDGYVSPAGVLLTGVGFRRGGPDGQGRTESVEEGLRKNIPFDGRETFHPGNLGSNVKFLVGLKQLLNSKFKAGSAYCGPESASLLFPHPPDVSHAPRTSGTRCAPDFYKMLRELRVGARGNGWSRVPPGFESRSHSPYPRECWTSRSTLQGAALHRH